MKCRDFVEFLIDYVEGDLDEPERAVFEQHTSDCPPCQTYLDTYRETIRLGKAACTLCDDLDGPVPEDVPEQLVRAILRARESS